MQIKHLKILFFFLFLGFISCTQAPKQDANAYRLGGIGAFSELVNAGVKQIALSEPLSSAEMAQFLPEAKKVADRHGVSIYQESDLLITDLFPADVAKEKEVLLLFQGNTLDAYLQLKEDKKQLVATNQYEGAARAAISRRFGRLLSYTPRGINNLLAKQTDFRTMRDFGIEASNVFLYYKDLDSATRFYQETLGLELVADYQMATIFRVATQSYLILVDASKGMHTAEEPKTVALALLTDQLDEWWTYLNEQKVPVKYSYKPKEGGAHDGFVMVDPEGYLLEFERFKQHPENEAFIPVLNTAETLLPSHETSKVPEGLGFKSTITWLYYKDMLAMQDFYQEVLGLDLVADQGWTKIYQVSETGFIGLVDERRGMHQFTEDKAVTVSFFLKDVKGWFDYIEAKQTFELRTGKFEAGPEDKYNAFVGYDPEGYFLEFDRFLAHPDNERLLECINGEKIE